MKAFALEIVFALCIVWACIVAFGILVGVL